MPTTQSPSLVQLKRALEISEEIQQLEAELAAILGSGVTQTATSSKAAAAGAPAKGKRGPKGKRFVSPEARAKMAAAQRARWAKSNGSKAGKAAPAAKAAPAKAAKAAKAAKPGKKAGGSAKFTPEWRAKLAEAARARWARQRSSN